MFRSPKVRIWEEYEIARNLFHEGKRERAIASFASVLDSPDMPQVPKVDAACSLGETYRGLGEFQKAQQYYELAVNISKEVPIPQQDAYFIHYCPRAYLGLIITMRRKLDEKHNSIFELIKEAKERFTSYSIPDLKAQLIGLEGLYLRQLGEVESSIAYLEECVEDMNELTLDYVLLLYKEHYQALLLMSYACLSGNNRRALPLGRKLIKEDSAIWSTAVASMSILHIQIKKAYRFEQIVQGALNEKLQNEIEESFAAMRKAAQFEQDPLILTETYMLEIAWAVISGEYHKLKNALHLFFRELERVTEPIYLLRAIELAIVQEEVLAHIPEFEAAIQAAIQKGRKLFDKWIARLQSFGCELDILLLWRSIIKGTASEYQTNISMLFHDDIYQLRARVWS